MKYKILEGITTADVAYEVYGKTVEELFEHAAEAVEQTMGDLSLVEPSQHITYHLSRITLEDLLLDFLNEILFYKDSRQLLFSKFDIKINKLEARTYQLEANLWGEKIDLKKHKLKCDVKAITRYKFSLKKLANKYVARIVLDI